MKKKLVLLITILISLFIYSGRVEADVRLSCLYGKSGNDGYVIFNINDDNSYEFLIGESTKYEDKNLWKKIEIDSPILRFGVNWQLDVVDQIKLSFPDEGDLIQKKLNLKNVPNDSDEVIIQDDLSKINKCYKNLMYYSTLGNNGNYSRINNVYFFHDGTTDLTTDFRTKNNHIYVFNHQLIKKIDDYNDTDHTPSVIVSSLDDTSKEIGDPWKKKWDVRCVYEEFDLFVNKDKFLFRVKSKNNSLVTMELKFDFNELTNNNGGNCPEKFFIYDASSNLSPNYKIVYLNEKDISISDLSSSHLLKTYFASDDSYNSEVETCRDLIGEKVFEKINDYFKIIRIVIPVLIIGFGIFDFAKAVFGNDDDMKKARKVFVMRIVAAILFFLLPLFLKFILDIANQVWNVINPETCIEI